MLVWHPHGFITWVPFFIAGRYALDAQPTGAHWFPMVAPVLFRIPIFSEMLIILGARRVDKKVVEKMLARGDSIALQPGGVKEQALSDDQQEQAFFPARLGFIRMAIKYLVASCTLYTANTGFAREQTSQFARCMYDINIKCIGLGV